MPNAYQIAYLVTNLFNLYVIKKFMDVFFRIKKGYGIYAFIGYLLYYIITSAIYLIFDIPLLNAAVNVILMFGITLFYDSGIKKKIWSVVFLYLVLALVELAITIMTLNSGFNWMTSLGYSNIFWLFAMKLIQFAMVLLIHSIVKIKSTGEVPVPFLLTSIFLPVLSIFMLMKISIIENIQARTIVTMTILLFLINTAVFFMYDSYSVLYERQLQAVLVEQESQFYYHQCQLMKESAEDVKDFRHDLNNHMMMLSELLDHGKTDEAQDYIHSLTKQTKELTFLFSQSGNIVIDSIINYKLRNISTACDIEVDTIVPTELPVEIVDLSMILTNLLDNALRALAQIEKGKLVVITHYKKGILYIIVRNSYNGDVRYENGEIITTKRDGDHGRGLKLVEKAIDKYDGLLKIDHTDDLFSVEALLYAGKNLRR